MAQCVEFVNGVLQQSPADLASCTGYLLLTPQEFSATQSPFFVPLSMTDGVLIASAMGALWGLAWLLRYLGSYLSSFGSTQGD